MKITVKLFSTLRAGRFDVGERDYADGTTAGKVCGDLDISLDQKLIILVNGRHADPDYRLSENDTLAIFHAVGGG